MYTFGEGYLVLKGLEIIVDLTYPLFKFIFKSTKTNVQRLGAHLAIKYQDRDFWGWHYLSMVSAILVGANCYIIGIYAAETWHVNLLLAHAMGLSGFILNTKLYWTGSAGDAPGAEKFRKFFNTILPPPTKVTHSSVPWSLQKRFVNARTVFSQWLSSGNASLSLKQRIQMLYKQHSNACIALVSGICIGCLSYVSCIEVATKFLKPSAITLFACVMALSNAFSTIALLFVDESNTTAADTPQGTIQKNQKPLLAPQIIQTLSATLAFASTLAFSYLNYTSVFAILIRRTGHTIAKGSSFLLASTLFWGELQFNRKELTKCITWIVDQVKGFKAKDPLGKITQTISLKQLLFVIKTVCIMGLIGLNAYANGLISLADLNYLPIVAQNCVVSAAAIISMSIMSNCFLLDTQDSTSKNYFPKKPLEQARLIQALIATLSLPLSCFIAFNLLEVTYPELLACSLFFTSSYAGSYLAFSFTDYYAKSFHRPLLPINTPVDSKNLASTPRKSSIPSHTQSPKGHIEAGCSQSKLSAANYMHSE
ncbi:MAG: hypothetical protein VXY77_03340 [Pseudomonadota bacterium]|nr:hypothetical protein [Pseudomonadota bacterium]